MRYQNLCLGHLRWTIRPFSLQSNYIERKLNKHMPFAQHIGQGQIVYP